MRAFSSLIRIALPVWIAAISSAVTAGYSAKAAGQQDMSSRGVRSADAISECDAVEPSSKNCEPILENFDMPPSAASMIADLTRKLKAIEPTADEEKWRRIPWRIDLMAARDEAAAENKPIFLWLMNGHPMGCT